MTRPLTLLVVHAHPDDESSSTGGVLARYSAEGIRTVVVTCTNGEFGDGPGGVKPGEDGHDPGAVAETRLQELEKACAELGVSHLETLGYHDSGMADWPYRDESHVFANVPMSEAVAGLGAVFERHRPDVVVTYNDADGYGHPDHVKASQVAMETVRITGVPAKAYHIARRARGWERLREILLSQGVEMPTWPTPDPERQARMAALEARITTAVDVTDHIEVKHAALNHHASQIAESFFGKLPLEAFAAVFGEETFIRVHDRTGVAVPEDDLFAGLR